MKTINYIAFGLSVLFALPLLSFAQRGRLNYANKMYQQKAYYYASEGYEDVLERKTDSSDVAVNIADSYDKLGNTEKAVNWYAYLKRKGKIDKNQLLRLALLERQLGNYDDSKDLLTHYASKYEENEIVKNILNADVTLKELRRDKGWFTVKRQNINTEFSEMGVSFLKDNVVLFSSSQRRSNVTIRVDSWTGDYFYNLYQATIGKDGKISNAKHMKSKAKTKFHDGPAVYNEKTGYVYFTRNNFIHGKKGTDENKVVKLKLYRAKLQDNKFKDVVELGIDDDSYSTAHPSLSKDGKKLYFSSDRPGGKGGMDIYYVNLDADGLPIGTPINMGDKVNTPGDEVFPHYNSRSNLLFFSSNGHFGLGGLDVYVAKLDGKGKTKNIENLGTPINSPHDDFSYTSDEEQTKGYFSSNRPGGIGSDDIYGFDQNVAIRNGAVLKGNVKDLITKDALGDVNVLIADKDGKVLDSITSDKDGNYEISLNAVNDDFEIIAKKNGYVQGQKTVDYDNVKDEYIRDMDLMPNLDYYFVGTIKDKETKKAIQGAKISIYDKNKNSEEFAVVETTEDGKFKTNPIPYKYNDHINYAFKLQKDGYVTKDISLGDLLAKKQEINVSDYLSFDMTKIEVGKTDLNDVVDIKPIHFDFNKSNIRPDAAKELDKVVKIMQDNPGMVIELRAYTDQRGDDAYNLKLSDSRARSSADYIISRGISKSRISGRGYGEANPIYTEKQILEKKSEEVREALYEKNRRTEFIVVKMNK